MDMKELIEGNTLNATLVGRTLKQGKIPTAVILSSGAMKTMPDNTQKFNLLVEFDGRQLNWTPNKQSMSNIAYKHGYDSQNWIGKSISLNIILMQNGKEGVIANPQ